MALIRRKKAARRLASDIAADVASKKLHGDALARAVQQGRTAYERATQPYLHDAGIFDQAVKEHLGLAEPPPAVHTLEALPVDAFDVATPEVEPPIGYRDATGPLRDERFALQATRAPEGVAERSNDPPSSGEDGPAYVAMFLGGAVASVSLALDVFAHKRMGNSMIVGILVGGALFAYGLWLRRR